MQRTIGKNGEITHALLPSLSMYMIPFCYIYTEIDNFHYFNSKVNVFFRFTVTTLPGISTVMCPGIWRETVLVFFFEYAQIDNPLYSNSNVKVFFRYRTIHPPRYFNVCRLVSRDMVGDSVNFLPFFFGNLSQGGIHADDHDEPPPGYCRDESGSFPNLFSHSCFLVVFPRRHSWG